MSWKSEEVRPCGTGWSTINPYGGLSNCCGGRWPMGQNVKQLGASFQELSVAYQLGLSISVAHQHLGTILWMWFQWPPEGDELVLPGWFAGEWACFGELPLGGHFPWNDWNFPLLVSICNTWYSYIRMAQYLYWLIVVNSLMDEHRCFCRLLWCFCKLPRFWPTRKRRLPLNNTEQYGIAVHCTNGNTMNRRCHRYDPLSSVKECLSFNFWGLSIAKNMCKFTVNACHQKVTSPCNDTLKSFSSMPAMQKSLHCQGHA